MQIGAQLYTVREHCTTLDDFALTLKKVADIGYKTVQVSGVCPFEPEWLQAQLKQNGLKCVITHTNGARQLCHIFYHYKNIAVMLSISKHILGTLNKSKGFPIRKRNGQFSKMFTNLLLKEKFLSVFKN